ncbi:MAG: hypothetical protein ACE5IE_03045 [Dehalococcoidia bacterium]
MPLEMKTLAVANLTVQLLLIMTVFAAAYLAKRRRAFGKHCTIMRVAVPLQIIVIAGVMLPSMLGYIKNEQAGALFSIEMLIHHSLGLVVVALWVYINLVFVGVIKMRGRPVVAMRVAFASWVLTLFLGLHLYVLIWM